MPINDDLNGLAPNVATPIAEDIKQKDRFNKQMNSDLPQQIFQQ